MMCGFNYRSEDIIFTLIIQSTETYLVPAEIMYPKAFELYVHIRQGSCTHDLAGNINN